MKRKNWYIVAYDISNPKRLAKIHRMLRKNGISAQKSVFFVKGTESDINKLLDQIASFMVLREDDLRAYPIIHPEKVWTSGPNPLADFPIVEFGNGKKNEPKQRKSKFKRLTDIYKVLS